MKRKLLNILILSMVLVGGIYAGGNKEVPEVPPVSTGTQYISPNGDGIQESATLEFTAKVYVKSNKGYIPEYGIQIFNQGGTLVHEVVETEPSDVNWFFALFKGYDLFELTKKITWNGRDESGALVAEGVYDVQLYVLDSSDNRTEVDVESFVIDVTPPEAKLMPPEEKIFSPNGDGVADVFIIQQEGSEEAEWKGSITSAAGQTVREYIWTDAGPGDVLWDGSNEVGTKVDDGLYLYTLQSTDLAGNSSPEYRVEDITVNAATPAIAMELSSLSFSPNGDGVLDTITVDAVIQNSDEVVSWSASVLSESRRTVVEIEAVGAVPPRYVLTGYGEDGRRMPEGFYTLAYSVTYVNGFSATAERRIHLDVTDPVVEIKYDSVFSPNGDGQNDFNDVAIIPSEDVAWEGRILDASGRGVIEGSGEQLIRQFRWDGRGLDGEVLADGSYFVKGVFTDRAGNIFVPDPMEIRIDNREVSVALTVPKGFSPNGDGKDDLLPVIIEPSLDADIASWKVSFENQTGEAVKSYSGSGNLPAEVFWDGTREGSARLAPEGYYTASLLTVYAKGDVVEERSDRFTLDITPPRIRLAVQSQPFARTNGDIEGEVTVAIEVEEETGVSEWSMDILNSRGEIIRSYTGTGDPADSISWNGTLETGEAANPDDNYNVQVTIVDIGGNQATYTEELPFDVAIMVKDGKYYILTPNIIFGAYKHTLDSAGTAMLSRNEESLDRAAKVLQKYTAYDLYLEGHALNIYLNGSREEGEEKILGPLTDRRASSVRDALIERGIDPDRINVEAYGGQFPIVSVSDKTIWWKNRRVEFRLEKK